MRRFLRYLRIAFSVTCGIACLLLIALWVRSYWWCDIWQQTISGRQLEVIAVEGRLKITKPEPPYWVSGLPPIRSYRTGRPEAETLTQHVRRFANARGFGIEQGESKAILVPYWFLLIIGGTCSAVPWIRRFSLRSLLVATSLVAVVLGAIVYAVK
jgi:hypothetical protein